MDDQQFDTFARNLASGTNRRAVLKGLLGLGGVAAAAIELHSASAARRGFSGPALPGFTPTEPPCVNPPSCASGQSCCSGYYCCNGQCIANDLLCGVV